AGRAGPPPRKAGRCAARNGLSGRCRPRSEWRDKRRAAPAAAWRIKKKPCSAGLLTAKAVVLLVHGPLEHFFLLLSVALQLELGGLGDAFGAVGQYLGFVGGVQGSFGLGIRLVGGFLGAGGLLADLFQFAADGAHFGGGAAGSNQKRCGGSRKARKQFDHARHCGVSFFHVVFAPIEYRPTKKSRSGLTSSPSLTEKSLHYGDFLIVLLASSRVFPRFSLSLSDDASARSADEDAGANAHQPAELLDL